MVKKSDEKRLVSLVFCEHVVPGIRSRLRKLFHSALLRGKQTVVSADDTRRVAQRAPARVAQNIFTCLLKERVNNGRNVAAVIMCLCFIS